MKTKKKGAQILFAASIRDGIYIPVIKIIDSVGMDVTFVCDHAFGEESDCKKFVESIMDVFNNCGEIRKESENH